jgi:predicted HTH domain antitoxin
MSIELQIPDTIAQAIRLPEERIARELLMELAIALYAQGFLSFGKARELAGIGKFEFGRLLGERSIARHYGWEELKDDFIYAGRE